VHATGPTDPDAFLLALTGAIEAEPAAAVRTRQVAAAAATARAWYVARRARLVQLAVAVVVVSALFGGGSVAAAGGLAPPVQDVVADVARAIPIPLPIPYSTTSQDTRRDGADQAEAVSGDGGLVYAVIDAPAPVDVPTDVELATSDSSDPVESQPQQTSMPCSEDQRDDNPSSRCDANQSEIRAYDARRDRDRHEEAGGDFEDTGDRGTSRSDQRDGERDRDRQDQDHDEEEERHDEHEDDRGSSDDEWRDGHD
jgi:hypothetical protein